jgi:pimeloyl-ACP methyl ester carboxylesterase
MKRVKIQILVTLFISGSFIFSGCGGNATETQMVVDNSPEPEIAETGTWEIIQFTSQALADNLVGDPAIRTVRIYLPPSYGNSDKRYPVVYALHGYLEDSSWLLGMGQSLNELIKDGSAQEMILVFPDGDNFFGGSFYLSSPVIGDYETYISKELVNYIDTNYLTIEDRDARGIAGCSMGGNGALHLAFTNPDIFSVAGGASGGYAYEKYPQLDEALEVYAGLQPIDLEDVPGLPWYVRVYFAMAAAAAPNLDDTVFHFDLPFEVSENETQNVPEVIEKISDADVYQDVVDYLDQPLRVKGIAIYHGVQDDIVPIQMGQAFSEFLTEHDVQHEFVTVDDGHCDRSWDYSNLLIFMSEHFSE